MSVKRVNVYWNCPSERISMAKRIGVCLLAFAMMFSALSKNAAAATSNPIISQTGPLGNILNIMSVLGSGTLLDSVPGTNI
jgi:hypothetical protein